MAHDLHQKIRAYLRQHGKTNMGGFHLDWAEGRTSIGRWDYSDVPQPTNDSLGAVEQQYLDYETDTVYTHDIYKAVVTNAPAGLGWILCTLTEERRPDVTELVVPDSIQLTKGFWEIKLQGFSSSAFTLQIRRSDDIVIYQNDCPVGRSTDRHIFHVEGKIEIRVRARRISRDSLLNPDFFIVLGQI